MSQDFNTILYSALCACFGLVPSSPEASVLICEAYQEPENAPRLPRNSDVIYYSVSPDVSAQEAPPANSMDHPADASHEAVVSSFSAWTMTVVCYGPHALSNARKIRAFLFVDSPGFPREILRKAGIRPVPDPPEPMLLREPEGSLRRERTNLTILLRSGEKETHPARRGAVTVPPAVRIYSGG